MKLTNILKNKDFNKLFYKAHEVYCFIYCLYLRGFKNIKSSCTEKKKIKKETFKQCKYKFLPSNKAIHWSKS